MLYARNRVTCDLSVLPGFHSGDALEVHPRPRVYSQSMSVAGTLFDHPATETHLAPPSFLPVTGKTAMDYWVQDFA